MVDPTTVNIQLFQPTRGSDVGVWDTPMNGNTSILDLVLGGVATISLGSSTITLTASQYESKTITFNSTLLASVLVNFPSTFIKSYEIYNVCTGSSAFTVTLGTTTGGQVVCAPPGETVEVWSDGSNIRYKNLGRIGTFWDYAGSSVPAWVTGCTVPPYLNCDGTTFSSGTYPQLTTILGSTTLPDSKGRFRATLSQGSSRLTTAGGGLDGTTNYAGGGGQTATIGTSNLPFLNTNSGSNVTFWTGNAVNQGNANPGASFIFPDANFMSRSAIGILNSSLMVSAPVSEIPPAYIGGLTLIRAA